MGRKNGLTGGQKRTIRVKVNEALMREGIRTYADYLAYLQRTGKNPGEDWNKIKEEMSQRKGTIKSLRKDLRPISRKLFLWDPEDSIARKLLVGNPKAQIDRLVDIGHNGYVSLKILYNEARLHQASRKDSAYRYLNYKVKHLPKGNPSQEREM